jgi:ribosome maturation factor RimP
VLLCLLERVGGLVRYDPVEVVEGLILRESVDDAGREEGSVLWPSLDDLTRVSRQLSDLLDVHDVLDGPYTLEVSSPGVNRLLKRPEHFSRFVGKRIRVRTRESIDGRRSFLGLLKEVGDDRIVVVEDKAEFVIPLSVIGRANYEHDWSRGVCSKT